MKRLGPELKLPELKAPTFLVDLWWDLWDRRLLPLVALALVAIAAVPFLLSSGSGESTVQTAARQAASAAAVERADSPASTLTVVEEEPGLRDYRRRFAHRRPTDPFKQRFAPPAPSAAAASGAASGSTTATVPATSPTTQGGGQGTAPAPQPASSPSSGSGKTNSGKTSGGAPSSGGKAKHHLLFFTTAIRVKVTRSGGKQTEAGEKPQSWTWKQVLPLTPLPGRKAPVVTYMGVSKKGKPLLLVSTRVRSVFGEARCVSGGEVCELIEVEPTFPVTFVYGFNEVRFRVNVLSLKLVVTKRT